MATSRTLLSPAAALLPPAAALLPPAAALALAACTSPAANYCDEDKPCTNPVTPFCDINGEFGPDGRVKTCIASPFDAMPNLATLTIQLEGSGGGTVTVGDNATTCSQAECTIDVEPGTPLTLGAVPTSGSSFVTWGGACSGFEACELQLDTSQTVSAHFAFEGSVLWTATAALSATVGSEVSRITPIAVATDSLDNVVVAGSLVGTPDFGGGPLQSGDPTFGSSEVFAVQYDASGNHRWSHAYSGTGFSDDITQNVGITKTDEVVLVGKFEDALTFDGPGDALDGSVNDMFMARLSSEGSHLSSVGILGRDNSTLAIDSEDSLMVGVSNLRFDWLNPNGTPARSLLPTPPSGTVTSSTVDGFGRAVVVGTLEDRVDFAPNVAGGEVGTSATTQPYIAKLNWDATFHDSHVLGVEAIECVVADPEGDGSYYVVGSLTEQVDLQGGGGGVIVPTGTRNGFVAKFSNNSSHLWSVHVPSSDISAVTACALDPRGDLLVGGSFESDVRLTPTANVRLGPGTFVAKYDGATGSLQWDAGGTGNGTVVGLASDSVGRATAVIQYAGSSFVIAGQTFPEAAGVPNLVVVQHAP